MNITTLGIDLAKNTFSVHGVDAMSPFSKVEMSPFEFCGASVEAAESKLGRALGNEG